MAGGWQENPNNYTQVSITWNGRSSIAMFDYCRYVYVYIYIYTLVSGIPTLWKILVNWDDYSQLNGKIKVMFQTTNQNGDHWYHGHGIGEIRLTFDHRWICRKIQLDRPWRENARLLDVCSWKLKLVNVPWISTNSPIQRSQPHCFLLMEARCTAWWNGIATFSFNERRSTKPIISEII